MVRRVRPRRRPPCPVDLAAVNQAPAADQDARLGVLLTPRGLDPCVPGAPLGMRGRWRSAEGGIFSTFWERGPLCPGLGQEESAELWLSTAVGPPGGLRPAPRVSPPASSVLNSRAHQPHKRVSPAGRNKA